MDINVSDFKLAESIIRKLCRKYDVTFVDVLVSFKEIVDNALLINDSKNVAQTIYTIVGEYINKSYDITGVQFMPDNSMKDDFLIVLATNLRNFVYGNDNVHSAEEPHILRLYQYPIVWILMKDIICPTYNKELINIKLITGDNPQIDIAKYYKAGDIPINSLEDEPLIFINRISNHVVQNAFLFIEALRAYELSPLEVIKEIYETELYNKFHGLLELALDDDGVNDFECTVMAILGINFYNLISKKMAKLNLKFMKTAQNAVSETPNQFWYFGILEKMLEPVRGADWSVYKSLEPYVQEFWNKVEDVKKKRIKSGHDPGVPFDLLLRLKSKQTVGYETDTTQTIENLLASDRVW
jgi:hypothetical protein